MREPVNRFPEFVGYVARRLKVLCPSMAARRIARVLARAGLNLGATTVLSVSTINEGDRITLSDGRLGTAGGVSRFRFPATA